MDEIKRLDIDNGDDVVVIRSGDVIPKIIRRAKRGARNTPFTLPQQCPECHTTIIKDPDEIAYRCPNRHCPARIRGQLTHFASRKAMDIDGLGKEVVALLVGHQLVNKVPDLYTLSIDQLLPLPRLAHKSANALLNAIDASKTQSLDRLIFGLGIPYVGEQSARLLATRYHSLSGLLTATQDDLLAIEGIGPKSANMVMTYLTSSDGQDEINALCQLGLNLKHNDRPSEGPLSGQSFLITGTLNKYTRSEAEARIHALGGKVIRSVNQSLTYLVVGDNPGSKLNKVEKINTKTPVITIVNESQFIELIQ